MFVKIIQPEDGTLLLSCKTARFYTDAEGCFHVWIDEGQAGGHTRRVDGRAYVLNEQGSTIDTITPPRQTGRKE